MLPEQWLQNPCWLMIVGVYTSLNRAVFHAMTWIPAARKGRWDHLRCVQIPDVCPMLALDPSAQLSMAAGDPWT